MQHSIDETIVALASAPGAGAAGIIRLAGQDCQQVLDRFFIPTERDRWRNAQAAAIHSGTVTIARESLSWPVALYFWPGQRSYTGQPLAEIHTVSSPPLMEELVAECYRSGARAARPGEFTLRAFLSGRIDLIQAEAVLGVIDSHEQSELEQALRQLAGGISAPLACVRDNLLNLLADLEAGLDFVDEDIEFVSRETLIKRLEEACIVPEQLLSQSASRMQSTGRVRIVLAGLPNAGKSTLFNALVGREAALVSQNQGTTRDYLRTEVNWLGMTIELVDTAGWETAREAISVAAQRLSSEQFLAANLIIWCTASDLNAEQANLDAQLLASHTNSGRPILQVRTKSDLQPTNLQPDDTIDDTITVCARNRVGLESAMRAAVARLTEAHQAGSDLVGTTAARCRESLSRVISSLTSAITAAETDAGNELVAFEIREALDHLAMILGAVYTDDILDRVFSRFCIGK